MKRGAAGALLTLLTLPLTARGADWLQFNFDSRHSGRNPQETAIGAGNVATLHVLYRVALPSIADGAPALLTGVATAGGTRDLLFLNTRDGHILALDAADGSTVWWRLPDDGPNYTTSSPAVDPNRQFVYAYGLDGKAHKYNVRNGTEVTGGGWPQMATEKPDVEKGSAALSIATAENGASFLYVASGGYPGDAGDYQGHITAINLATGAQKVFNAACSNQSVHFVEGGGTPDCGHVQSAIWARPGVIYDSDLDLIFMATGNGDYDGSTGGHDWGDSVFALHPDGTGNASGNPVDCYTPTEFQDLQDEDADLGSTAPAVVPAPAGIAVAHPGVQSGKDAMIRLINLDNLSGAGGPGHVGGEIQKIPVPQGNEVLTQPAVWTNPADGGVRVFIANDSGISGLAVSFDGSGKPSMAPIWTNPAGGTSPVIANDLLFYAGSGALIALDPSTGRELWSDSSIGGVHWESPIVVNGRIFVTDENGLLWAYGPASRFALPVSSPTLNPVSGRR